MSAFHKDDGIYDKDEANICLTCSEKKCTGNCDRVRWERWKLKQKNKKKKGVK